jgi:trehalose-phosphatase
MGHVFDCWRQISIRMRASGSVALFMDFDGTLAPIRPRPEEVRLGHSTRRAIARLAGNPRVDVWVISGRRLSDVRVRICVPRVHYLGLHGWEGRPRAPLNPETRRLLECAKHSLANRIEHLPGIRIEDKGPVFTVHYRGASDVYICRARAAMTAVMASLTAGLRVFEGKKAWEILPWGLGDKGTAVQHQLKRYRRRALPVYLGDDNTDEPAFAALSHGVTIRVGRRSLTRAKFQLRDTDEVRSFLERLEAELS